MHKAFDRLANDAIQTGELPAFTRVRGKVAWYVYRGPYADLGAKGWGAFWQKVGAAKLRPKGAPGDVYVCSPDCHEDDRQAKMLTLLWAPLE